MVSQPTCARTPKNTHEWGVNKIQTRPDCVRNYYTQSIQTRPDRTRNYYT